jgi:hypothetical protein
MTLTLQAHFRPPLSVRRHWHAFHNAWVTYLASDFNSLLPEGYFAEPNVQFGIEIDVATFEESVGHGPRTNGDGAWNPPAPTQTIPFAVATDVVEVLLYDSREGPTLAAAVELVSPAHKDRSAHREAFVSKCETYLQAGAGLLIIDVVTDRAGSLHDELIARVDPASRANSIAQYAASYRPIERDGTSRLDIWHESLQSERRCPRCPCGSGEGCVSRRTSPGRMTGPVASSGWIGQSNPRVQALGQDFSALRIGSGATDPAEVRLPTTGGPPA